SQRVCHSVSLMLTRTCCTTVSIACSPIRWPGRSVKQLTRRGDQPGLSFLQDLLRLMRMGDYNSPMSDVNHDRYDDAYLRKILRETKTIAMVGASANWNRPSYFAMKYLLDRGYRIIPVNPAAAGQEIMGQKVYGSLDELPVKADMVDIFRNSEAAGPITDEAIRHGAKVVWMQLGVRNQEAARRAEAAGLKARMNRCPKIEHSRLPGSIEWHGIASGVISSKKRAL